ncbi:MAG: hypothetical protein EOP86_05955 [Verrucomicrobiaceae bacterium]|nr:MAG: hypothetical protein EOP86_05955 [Verrucomicrobiaceae bacterium]
MMLTRFKPGEMLLPPLMMKSCTIEAGPGNRVDARLELVPPGGGESFRFAVESKARATPQTIQQATAQIKAAAGEGEWPMIQVPYLPPERIQELERDGVSGVDLCGNGVVIVPGRLWVVRVGNANQYRDSRPLSNPYRGRSAMVARMLMQQPRWSSLSELASAITAEGAELSLPQVSKAVRALKEDLMVLKDGGAIRLQNSLRLMDKLGREWRKPQFSAKQACRLPGGAFLPGVLAPDRQLKWALTGESSVTRYAVFMQSGPPQLAVSSIPQAMALLDATPETVRNFADIELVESDEAGFFFSNETDSEGLRWASRLQTWLELQSGDARQREAARELRDQLLSKVTE